MTRIGCGTRDHQRIQQKPEQNTRQRRQNTQGQAHQGTSRIQEAYQRERQNQRGQGSTHQYFKK